MFYIILVIVISLCLRSVGKDADKQIQLDERNKQEYSRKTNAKLESEIYHSYLDLRYSPEESYNKTIEDVIKRGFVPCIPFDTIKYKGEEYVQNFDSEWVKDRRNYLKLFGKPTTDEYIYSESPPRNRAEYICAIRESAKYIGAYPVRTKLYHNKYGKCIIVDIHATTSDIEYMIRDDNYRVYKIYHKKKYDYYILK